MTDQQEHGTAAQETLEATQSTCLTKLDHPVVYYGQEHQDLELVNWEEIFRAHVEVTRRLEKQK